ncbi:IS21 family transposase, partial [Microvirga sp. KLBC 81]
LLELAGHYGFHPRACAPYRAKTKGKVERPFRYIREDFFLARSLRNLEDLNRQLQDWLDTVANVRLHGTTQRIASEAFAAEQPALQPLPAAPFRAVLKLERRVTHEGLVSVGGNLYSVPDRTRRVVEVHQFADEIRIFDAGRLVAAHPVLDGNRRTLVAPSHRRRPVLARHAKPTDATPIFERTGDVVARRSLEIYAAVGRRLARGERA